MSDELHMPSTVDRSTIASFKKLKNSIIDQAVADIMRYTKSMEELGSAAEEKIRSGLGFTIEILISVMSLGDKNLLEDQLNWAKDRLPHDGVQPDHIMENMKILAGVINDLMTEKDAESIVPYMEWMIKRMEQVDHE
jgi:hypothetical protein